VNKLVKRLKEQQNVEYLLFNSIPIIIKDKLTNNIDIKSLIKSIENALPYSFRKLINSIIILDDPIFSQRKINAFYHNNTLFISNNQDDENDILDDIVHEYSHALEEKFEEKIYFDGSIKDEFISKRMQIERILRTSGYDTKNYDFKEISYNKSLDNLFLNVIGYNKFQSLTKYRLFINPYAATSLREYFATGFEEYILGDHKELEVISPKLYKKLHSTIQITQ
jgi:hypothetical protein